MKEVVLQPRGGVGDLIDKYAEGKLSFGDLQKAIAALGYKTTSVYEMVQHITPKKS